MQYEYLIRTFYEDVDRARELNKLGVLGWGLVTVWGGEYMFMRKSPPLHEQLIEASQRFETLAEFIDYVNSLLPSGMCVEIEKGSTAFRLVGKDGPTPRIDWNERPWSADVLATILRFRLSPTAL